jgi:hypothetical protein
MMEDGDVVSDDDANDDGGHDDEDIGNDSHGDYEW